MSEWVAPRARQIALLEGLLARGTRHALGQRLGCAVTTLGLVAGTLLLALGHYYVMAIVGAVAFVAYFAASALDPELADDRRVRVVRALLDELPIDAKGRRTLFTRGPIHVAMRTGTRFTLAFAASVLSGPAETRFTRMPSGPRSRAR